MKVAFWRIGKSSPSYFEEAEEEYAHRLSRYLPFELQTLREVRKSGKMSPESLKEKEEEEVLRLLKASDYLILLDEKGRSFSSLAFAKWMETRLNSNARRLIFLAGGAYGFSNALRQRADFLLSLSPMTFSHQLVRPVFLEQLYRAMTILKNEPYHNE